MSHQRRAELIQQQLDELGRISDSPHHLFRSYGSAGMRKANALVSEWMTDAGIQPAVDAIGNLRGRKRGRSGGDDLFILGSHLDTVPDAGKFDGPLGVLLAIEAVSKLTLPFDVEIIGFCDEEGSRFHSTYLGSATLAGRLPDLELTDAAGIKLKQAISEFGGDPDALHTVKISANRVLGYLEAHLEQGPVLQELGSALGIVTAIAGQTRAVLRLKGETGHAGTVPMAMRRDALCGASEFIQAVEHMALGTPGLAATIGKIEALPGASNVIPSDVALSLDVRHREDATREEALACLQTKFHKIAQRRSLSSQWSIVQSTSSVACSEPLSLELSQAIAEVQGNAPQLISGAGHDAAALATLCPIAMLFIRCRDGISHHPSESVSTGDITLALAAMERFLQRMRAA